MVLIIAVLTTVVPRLGQADELSKAQWLRRQSEQAVTLQLVSLTSEQQIERFVA